MNTPQGKDPLLWQQAENRVAFRRHLVVYLLVNAGLWVIWFLSGPSFGSGRVPWPVWSMFGWGIGLVSHYLKAFVFPESNDIAREYEALQEKKRNNS